MFQESNQAFGIDFFTGTKDELISNIFQSVRKPYKFIVTPNVDHVVQLNENKALRDAYKMAEIKVCDSRVLMPLLRSLGVNIKEVIPGSDLTIELLQEANKKCASVTIIGSSSEDVTKLNGLFPSVKIYHHNPPMGFIKDPHEIEKCLHFIYENTSDLILYAVGAPRQEMIASMVDSGKRTGVGVCIGASILFATGSLKRAPVWVQKARMEWLHRMLSEPRRLSNRYIRDAIYILPLYLKERSAKRGKKSNLV